MEILYEDNHIIAVNKEVSDIVQGDKTGDEPLADKVKAYIKEKYNKPGAVFLGVVHRIDRPTSGVVLFARTSKALARLNEMIAKRQIIKTYWAIVKNRPAVKSGTLEHYLLRDTTMNKSIAYDGEVPGSQKATLSYKVAAKSGIYYYLEIDLQTGRHHQIRAQLAKIGCPIKGDVKYGFDRANSDGGINLHARKIEFIHPVTKNPVAIVAPPPKGAFWDDFVAESKKIINDSGESKKIVIFDFDGVIADSFDITFAANKIIYPGITVDEFRNYFNGNINDSKQNLEKDEAEKEDERFFAVYEPLLMKSVRVFPGMKDVIIKLSKDYKLIIISSVLTNAVHEFLEKNGLDSYFRDILGNDVHNSKIEKIRMIFAKYAVEPKNCVMVTDTLGDMIEAHRAGIGSIGVTWGCHEKERLLKGKPARIVDKPEEISDVVANYFK